MFMFYILTHAHEAGTSRQVVVIVDSINRGASRITVRESDHTSSGLGIDVVGDIGVRAKIEDGRFKVIGTGKDTGGGI